LRGIVANDDEKRRVEALAAQYLGVRALRALRAPRAFHNKLNKNKYLQ
jgi:hypothetical protein